MPHFKPKATKKFKVNKNGIATIDSKHHEKMREFEMFEKVKIPELKKQKDKLFKTKKMCKTIEENLDIDDKLEKITKTIRSLRKSKKEYFCCFVIGPDE